MASELSAVDRFAGRLLGVLPLGAISHAVGWFADLRAPRFLVNRVIARFAATYGVNLSEAVIPPGGFRSFNEFFTRPLRDGLRPLHQGLRSVVSPADGRIEFAGELDSTSGFPIKGESYTVESLLGDREQAQLYAGGIFAVVYLSPRDYHRVHSPVSGEVRMVRHIPGSLFPVNAFGLRHYPHLFARNQRVVVTLDTPDFGSVAVILVGATIVGRIRLAFAGNLTPFARRAPSERHFAPGTGPCLKRGAELGAFELGSTVVVLLPAVAGSRWRFGPGIPGGPIRVGELLAAASG